MKYSMCVYIYIFICVYIYLQTIKLNQSLEYRLHIKNMENCRCYYKAVHNTYNHTEQRHTEEGKLTLEIPI